MPPQVPRFSRDLFAPPITPCRLEEGGRCAHRTALMRASVLVSVHEHDQRGCLRAECAAEGQRCCTFGEDCNAGLVCNGPAADSDSTCVGTLPGITVESLIKPSVIWCFLIISLRCKRLPRVSVRSPAPRPCLADAVFLRTLVRLPRVDAPAQRAAGGSVAFVAGTSSSCRSIWRLTSATARGVLPLAECGGMFQLPCLTLAGDPFCTIEHNDAGGRSGPNGNGLCVPCGFSGRPVCSGAQPADTRYLAIDTSIDRACWRLWH